MMSFIEVTLNVSSSTCESIGISISTHVKHLQLEAHI